MNTKFVPIFSFRKANLLPIINISIRQFSLSLSLFDPNDSNLAKKEEIRAEIHVGRAFNRRDHFENLCNLAQVKPRVGFIGGGNMAQALASGFLSTGLILKDNIMVADPDPIARKFWTNLDFKTFTNSSNLLDICSQSILILAVKPPSLPDLYKDLQNRISQKQIGLVVSVCAGATLKSLEHNFKPFGTKLPVIRVMPNTPALINCGAAVFSTGEHCTDAHAKVVQALVETVGTCHQLPEKMIDAVTGLSASGPAYIYTVIDAMSDGGVKMGLPRQLATHLAAQTVMGAAQMILRSDKHPGDLKNQVCSPGGTTIAGIHVLEEAGIRAAFISAVEKGTLKAKELGQE